MQPYRGKVCLFEQLQTFAVDTGHFLEIQHRPVDAVYRLHQGDFQVILMLLRQLAAEVEDSYLANLFKCQFHRHSNLFVLFAMPSHASGYQFMFGGPDVSPVCLSLPRVFFIYISQLVK
jgi:hypothetical protein